MLITSPVKFWKKLKIFPFSDFVRNSDGSPQTGKMRAISENLAKMGEIP